MERTVANKGLKNNALQSVRNVRYVVILVEFSDLCLGIGWDMKKDLFALSNVSQRLLFIYVGNKRTHLRFAGKFNPLTRTWTWNDQ